MEVYKYLKMSEDRSFFQRLNIMKQQGNISHNLETEIRELFKSTILKEPAVFLIKLVNKLCLQSRFFFGFPRWSQ